MPKDDEKNAYKILIERLQDDVGKIRDFLKGIQNVAIIPHWDSDGLTSAVLFKNALKSILPTILLPKTGHYGITSEIRDRLLSGKYELLLVTDKELQKHDIDRIKDTARKILIIDHHDFPLSTKEIPNNMVVINPKIYGINLNVPSGFLMYNVIKLLYPNSSWLRKAVHLAAVSIYCDYAEEDLIFFLNKEVFKVYPYLRGKWRKPKDGEKEFSTYVSGKLSFIVTDAYTHSLDRGADIAIKALEKSIENEDPLNILYGRDEESKLLRRMYEELRFKPADPRPLQEYYSKIAWSQMLFFDSFVYSEVNIPYFLGLTISRKLSDKYRVPAFIVNNFDYTQEDVLMNGYVSREARKKPDLRNISKIIADETKGEWFGSKYTASVSVPSWNAKKIIGILYRELEDCGVGISPDSHPLPYAKTSSSLTRPH